MPAVKNIGAKIFTILIKGGIIDIVKRNILLTTAVALALTATSAPITAYAEDVSAQTKYPVEFANTLEFTSLTDYAIYGDTYALAEGTKLYIISTDENGDRQININEGFDCAIEIKNLDYDENGDLYVGNAEGNAFKYPDMSVNVDYDFTSDDNIVIGNYTYFIVAGKLHWKLSDKEMDNFGEGFSKLKMYDGKAYVICNNGVFTPDANHLNGVTLDYTDLTLANKITTGNAKQALLDGYELKKVIVRPQTDEGGDVYCTEIELDNLSSPYFKAVKTTKQTALRTALAIAQTGNATIVIMNDENGETKSYLTLTSALEYTEDAVTDFPDLATAYILSDTKLYSRPYMSGATETVTLERGKKVDVTEKLMIDFADSRINFYKIAYEAADGTKTEGYIAGNYLTPHSFAAENETPDKIADEPEYDTALRTVLICILIVLLVFIAIGYVTYELTKGKDKKRKK